MDHSGALPLLHTQFPGVPVYLTAPTLGLIEVLLRDSLNIMRLRAEHERETPLYSQAAVDSLFDHVIPVTPSTPVALGRSGVTATFYPAGHILGASLVCLEGTEQGVTRRVIFSGDIAASDQRTVPGALPPRQLRPDVLVIEATYGDRLHAAREREEQALVELVTHTIEHQGHLLIPAFAVGRAQEILLLLLNRLRQHKLAKFPIYVDGMVRSVCQVYSHFPAYQTEATRWLIEHFGNPFFGATDEIRPVVKPAEREAILHGPPCVIVASSGMLSGGASAFYAQTMIHRPQDGIAFTGYQDEESPGQQLLDLADGRTNQIRLAGQTATVGCTVRKYSLSAHADGPEIARLVEAINPRQVVLVHGEGTARARLADLINRTAVNQRRIHLPQSGDTLRFETKRTSTLVPAPPCPPVAGPGAGRELDVAALDEMAAYLSATRAVVAALSALEMLNLWYGPGQWTETHYTRLGELLPKHPRFRRHPQRQQLWFVHDPHAPAPKHAPQAVKLPLQDAEEVLEKVRQGFRERPEAGLFHLGYHRGLRQIRLAFHFPKVARVRYAELLEQLLTGTGWQAHIRKEVHQESLAHLAQSLWPDGTELMRRPALLLGREAVRVHLAQALDAATVATTQAAFRERTGWELIVTQPARVPLAPEVPPLTAAASPPVLPLNAAPPSEMARAAAQSRPDAHAAPVSATLPAPLGVTEALVFTPPPDAAVREINACYSTLAQAWADAPTWTRPLKMGLKPTPAGEVLELVFLTPVQGHRQAALLTQLAAQLGRVLRVKPEPQTVALLNLARALVPPEWEAQKFGLHAAEGHISVKVRQLALAQSQVAAVSHQLVARTGYHLTLT